MIPSVSTVPILYSGAERTDWTELADWTE